MTDLQAEHDKAKSDFKHWHTVYATKSDYWLEQGQLRWWAHGGMLHMMATHYQMEDQVAHLKALLANNPLYYGDHKQAVIDGYVMQAKYKTYLHRRTSAHIALVKAGR